MLERKKERKRKEKEVLSCIDTIEVIPSDWRDTGATSAGAAIYTEYIVTTLT